MRLLWDLVSRVRKSRCAPGAGEDAARGPILAALLLPIAAALACGGPADLESARSSVVAADSAWQASFASEEGLDAILSYLADDAVLIPPGRAPVRGKRAIRAYMAAGLETPGFSVSWETLDARVSPSGEFAYLTQRTRIAARDSAGELVTFRGRGVTIWERAESGAWRCVLYVWNQGGRTERRTIKMNPV